MCLHTFLYYHTFMKLYTHTQFGGLGIILQTQNVILLYTLLYILLFPPN